MADIVSLPGIEDVDRPASAQPQPEIIDRLHELLRRAEMGDIQAIAYCYVNEGGAPCEGHLIPDRVPRAVDYTLGFAAAALFHRFFTEQVAGSRNTAPLPPDPA